MTTGMDTEDEWDKFDQVLLPALWLTKAESKRWLFKFAPHPDKPGYIFLATDLERVLYDSLTLSEFPSRFPALDKSSHASSSSRKNVPKSSASSRHHEEDQRRAEEEWKGLQSMMSGDEWDEITLGVVDNNTSVDFSLSHEGFTWLFSTTELTGRLPLIIISKHLIPPLTALVAQDRSIKMKGIPSIDSSLKILFDSQVNREMGNWNTKNYGPVPPTRDPTPLKSHNEVEEAEEESYTDDEDTRKEVSSPPRDSMHRTPPKSSGGNRPKSHKSPSVSVSPIPSPRQNKKAKTSPHHEPSRSASPESDAVPRTKALTNRSKRIKSPTPDSASDNERVKHTPQQSPTPVSRDKQGKDEEEVVTPTKKKIIQKSKEEREREEEEELERKRVALRKKMEAGGGGRLGKRRFGR